MLIVPVLAARPLDDKVAAGVFPPWWSQSQILAAASQAGQILRMGAVPFVVVVQDDEGAVAARLKEAGSLFSLDPNGAAGCAPR
jgi:hypothetical protein